MKANPLAEEIKPGKKPDAFYLNLFYFEIKRDSQEAVRKRYREFPCSHQLSLLSVGVGSGQADVSARELILV